MLAQVPAPAMALVFFQDSVRMDQSRRTGKSKERGWIGGGKVLKQTHDLKFDAACILFAFTCFDEHFYAFNAHYRDTWIPSLRCSSLPVIKKLIPPMSGDNGGN